MITKTRRLTHKTLKKKLDGVAEADAPFLEFAWSDGDPAFTWVKYLAKMKKKYGDDFTIHPLEDADSKKQSDNIKDILAAIDDGPIKQALRYLLKDKIQGPE